ncbi:MAG: molecular chaperone HtpG [Calditrichia bacterium]
MAEQQQKSSETFEYKAEMKQLLNLIIHSLYTHKEVFLRELVSNASDALNKMRFRMLTDKNVVDPEAELKIKIEVDEKKRTFSIEDSGIGMTRDDLLNEIGTVASSGTLEFIKQMQAQEKKVDGNLIGQFGVGFYSVFMVTDEVTIETRHADPDSKAYRWKSLEEGKFMIEEIERQARGTRISFTLREDSQEFAHDYRIKEIVNRYSNFVDFPIFLGKERINRVTALWQLPKSEQKESDINEFYKFISNDFEDPLAHLHLSIEGSVNFKALLFIPKTAPPFMMREEQEKTLQLYSNKIFIQDDAKELLPEYLRFIKGVVDTEDLPLNVSREWTQNSPTMVKIRNVMVGKLLSFLDEMAKNEAGKYKQFYTQFGPLFKLGVNSDFTNREKIINLLRFESTVTAKDELTSLQNYISRMPSDQKEIYYIAGENPDLIRRNPKLEYFRKNDIEVLLLTEPVDVFVVPSINEFDKKPLKSIDKADLDLKEDTAEKQEALSDNLKKSIINVFKETLGDKVEDVVESKRLVDSPATLVSGKEGMDSQMEKMMRMMNQEFTRSKKILEVNTRHPLIKNLAAITLRDSKDPLLRSSILQLYEGALLLEDNLDSPTEFIRRMSEIMEKATGRKE